jgi:hypothetical protein
VTHLPARFHILVTALRVRVISPSRDAAATHLSGLVASPVLSYRLLVLLYPERYAMTDALMVEAPIFKRNQTSQCFRLSSENIGSKGLAEIVILPL